MNARLFLVTAVLVVTACSDSSSGGSGSGSTTPSGVFTRSVSNPGPGGGTENVWLVFDGGRGARMQSKIDSSGKENRGVTCFDYETSGAKLKLTVRKEFAASGGATTSTEVNRIVEREASMSLDGSKLDANEFLEEGRYEYRRDTKSAAEIRSDCK